MYVLTEKLIHFILTRKNTFDYDVASEVHVFYFPWLVCHVMYSLNRAINMSLEKARKANFSVQKNVE